jgi:hypothetical protein
MPALVSSFMVGAVSWVVTRPAGKSSKVVFCPFGICLQIFAKLGFRLATQGLH